MNFFIEEKTLENEMLNLRENDDGYDNQRASDKCRRIKSRAYCESHAG